MLFAPGTVDEVGYKAGDTLLHVLGSNRDLLTIT
eukprot:gene13623-7958_t